MNKDCFEITFVEIPTTFNGSNIVENIIIKYYFKILNQLGYFKLL